MKTFSRSLFWFLGFVLKIATAQDEPSTESTSEGNGQEEQRRPDRITADHIEPAAIFEFVPNGLLGYERLPLAEKHLLAVLSASGSDYTELAVDWHAGNVFPVRPHRTIGSHAGHKHEAGQGVPFNPATVESFRLLSAYKINGTEPGAGTSIPWSLMLCSCARGNCGAAPAYKHNGSVPEDTDRILDAFIPDNNADDDSWCAKHEIFTWNPQDGGRGLTDRILALDFGVDPQSRQAVTFVSGQSVQLRGPDDGKGTFSVTLNLPRGMRIVSLSESVAPNQASMVVIFRPDLYDGAVHAIQHLPYDVTDDGGIQLKESLIAPKFLNHIYGSTGEGRLKDFCFGFRPDAGVVNGTELIIFEGIYQSRVKLRDQIVSLPIDQTRDIIQDVALPTKRASQAVFPHDWSRHWDVVVFLEPLDGMLFIIGPLAYIHHLYSGDVERGRVDQLFPGLTAQDHLDAGWLDLESGPNPRTVLHLVSGKLFHTFHVDLKRAQKEPFPRVSGPDDTRTQFFPFMKISYLDAAIQIPTNGTGLETFWFINGFFFSAKRSPRWSLDNGLGYGFIGGLEACGARYGLKEFNVKEHIRRLVTFHKAHWEPRGAGYTDDTYLGNDPSRSGLAPLEWAVIAVCCFGILALLAWLAVDQFEIKLCERRRSKDDARRRRFDRDDRHTTEADTSVDQTTEIHTVASQ